MKKVSLITLAAVVALGVVTAQAATKSPASSNAGSREGTMLASVEANGSSNAAPQADQSSVAQNDDAQSNNQNAQASNDISAPVKAAKTAQTIADNSNNSDNSLANSSDDDSDGSITPDTNDDVDND